MHRRLGKILIFGDLRVGISLESVMRTKYIMDDFQQTYFVIDSFETCCKRVIGILAGCMSG